jgi:hypothetical protein
MSDRNVYAVFLHPGAVDALGPAIKPYLIESNAGPHLQCVEVDSAGALFEAVLVGRDNEGRTLEVELMIPIAMIKLVISVRKDEEFGFGNRPGRGATASDPSPAASGASPAPSTVAPGAAAT